MLRVELEACRQREHLFLREAGSDELLRQLRFAVGQGSGFVENGGAAFGDLFKDGGILHHDRASRRQRNGADDRDRNGDEQWAGRGDHQHRQEPNSFTADRPKPEPQCSPQLEYKSLPTDLRAGAAAVGFARTRASLP